MQWEAHIHAGTHDYTNTHMLSMVIRQSCSSGMEPVATERERGSSWLLKYFPSQHCNFLPEAHLANTHSHIRTVCACVLCVCLCTVHACMCVFASAYVFLLQFCLTARACVCECVFMLSLMFTADSKWIPAAQYNTHIIIQHYKLLQTQGSGYRGSYWHKI